MAKNDFPKLTIRSNSDLPTSMHCDVMLDGHDITRGLRGIKLHMAAGELNVVILELLATVDVDGLPVDVQAQIREALEEDGS